MKNARGFTLIELIIVTIILGVLAAVAVPRYMGSVSNAEAAAEAGTIAALREAVEQYATQKFLETGRYEYPENPFDYVEVDGFTSMEWEEDGARALQIGSWVISPVFDEYLGVRVIGHKRRDSNFYWWTFFYGDLTDLDADDRGAYWACENPVLWFQEELDNDNIHIDNGVRDTHFTGDLYPAADAF